MENGGNQFHRSRTCETEMKMCIFGGTAVTETVMKIVRVLTIFASIHTRTPGRIWEQ